MTIEETKLKGCYIVTPYVHGGDGGYFAETYKLDYLKDKNEKINFIEGNELSITSKNTIRGLSFQNYPFTQAKLVRCIEGAICNVAVDLREDSKTYKEWIKVDLSKDNKKSIFLPRGFAHGFITLTDNATLICDADNYYNAKSSNGIVWNDPEIGIDWGLEEGVNPILSDKDAKRLGLSRTKFSFKEVV